MTKLTIKIIVALLVIFIITIFLQCGPNDVSYGGSSTETIGKLVDELGTVQKDAKVLLFIADSKNDIVDSTYTNGVGDYKFDKLSTGKYTIVGYSKTDGKSVYIEPFEYDSLKQDHLDEPYDNGSDTVRAPGSIGGCVTYPTIDQSGRDVIVYIPGTSFMIWASNGSPFTMSNIPKGIYSLKFDRDNFSIKSIQNIQVKPGITTNFDSCVTLDVDTNIPPPAPQVLTIMQNPTKGTLHLNWHRVPVSDLADYVIYKESSGKLNEIRRVADTFFIDTVFNNLSEDTVSKSFTYQIKTIDKENNESSTFSARLMINAFPQCFYRCQFTWNVKNVNGHDTITNADSAVITVNYENRKRTPKQFIWCVDKIQNEISNHAISATRDTLDSVSRGTDRFSYRWNTPGSKTVYIKSIDDQGDSWLDSFKLSIIDSTTLHPKETWVPLAVMNTKRSFATAEVFDSVIYVFGGYAIKSDGIRPAMMSSISSVEKFNLRNGAWTKGIDLPEKRFYATSTVLNGKIYVFGGAGLSSICSYKPGDAAWVKCGNLPCNLSGMSACNYDNKVLIVGGQNDNLEAMDIILSYNPLTNSVEVVDTLGVADGKRACHRSFVYKDNLYIIGGTDGVIGYSNVIVYNLKTKIVIGSFPMSKSRLNFAAWTKDNYLYIAGGASSVDEGTIFYNDAEVLDLNLKEKKWNPIENLPRTVIGAASVCAGDGLFIIGGSINNQIKIGNEIQNIDVYYP